MEQKQQTQLSTLADFAYALAEHYPKSSGEADTPKREQFLSKVINSLKSKQDIKTVDFNRLLELVLKEAPSYDFAPSVELITKCAKRAFKKPNYPPYISNKLVSYCLIRNGRIEEYAYPKRDEEKYLPKLNELKEQGILWFGTIRDCPDSLKQRVEEILEATRNKQRLLWQRF